MRRYVLLYGIISGILLAVYLGIWATMPLDPSMNHELAMVQGYLWMLLCLSFTFVGVRAYRQKELGGTITFGRAFLCSILMTLVASIMYVGAWEVYFNTMASDWMDQYTACMIESMKADGISGTTLDAQTAELQANAATYKTNAFVRMAFTFMEIIPAALLASLVTATILRKKPTGATNA